MSQPSLQATEQPLHRQNKSKNKNSKSQNRKNRNSQRLIRSVHIYSSMLMLLIMLFFTFTGITLNHRDWLPEPAPQQVEDIRLPDHLSHPELWQQSADTMAPQIIHWLQNTQHLYGNQIRREWHSDERLLIIDAQYPGGYTLVEVFPDERLVQIEDQSFGLLATLNNLHMGRYSGPLWQAFIDVSAALMLLFTLSGFWLVMPQKNAANDCWQSQGAVLRWPCFVMDWY